MGWFDAVPSVLIQLVSAVLVGLVGLAVSAVSLTPRIRSRFRRSQTTSGANAVPRQVRRQHRQPTTQLPGTYDNCTAEMLAKSIRVSGRVPIDYRKNRPWHLSFWRALVDLFAPTSTNPKPAFTLTDWEYQPNSSADFALQYPYSGGSMLCLKLHSRENRSHFKRSLNADKSKGRARRLVVVASARDVFEPDSLVRCLVVNAYSLQLLGEGDSRAVAMRTADPLSLEQAPVHQRKQKDVPADAVWLIVPTSNYRAPSDSWGKLPERHNEQTMRIDPMPEESNDADAAGEYVKKRMANLRTIRPATWAYFGLFVPGLVWGYVTLVLPFRFPTIVLVVWYTAYAVALLADVARLVWTSVKALCWRRRDGQTRRAWQGRTNECLFMGTLLRNGPNLSRKEWREHYFHAFHMSEPRPATHDPKLEERAAAQDKRLDERDLKLTELMPRPNAAAESETDPAGHRRA